MGSEVSVVENNPFLQEAVGMMSDVSAHEKCLVGIVRKHQTDDYLHNLVTARKLFDSDPIYRMVEKKEVKKAWGQYQTSCDGMKEIYQEISQLIETSDDPEVYILIREYCRTTHDMCNNVYPPKESSSTTEGDLRRPLPNVVF